MSGAKKKTPHSVWIVEAKYCDDKRGWHPTVGVALTRADGRPVLADWKRRNPDDRFRLVQYMSFAP